MGVDCIPDSGNRSSEEVMKILRDIVGEKENMLKELETLRNLQMEK